MELFQQHQDEIGCVLCDLTMPRMNGWQTLTALRQLAPGIPVILASGYSEIQAMQGQHDELPQAFLSKPYQAKELGEAIARAMRNGSRWAEWPVLTPAPPAANSGPPSRDARPVRGRSCAPTSLWPPA